MVDILERGNENFKGKEDKEVFVSVGINPMVFDLKVLRS